MASTFKIKDPDAPASQAQLNALTLKMIPKITAEQLAGAVKAAGLDPATFNVFELTKGDASKLITHVGNVIDAAEAGPKQSLVEMAKAIESKGAPIESKGASPVAFTAADAKVALSWFPVMAAEVDVSDEDERVMELLQLIAAAVEVKGLEDAVQSIAAEKFAKPQHDVPDGHYAIGDPADTKFYRVQNGVDKTAHGGKDWTGWVFVEQQVSDEFLSIKNKYAKDAIVAAIKDQGILESSTRYGQELGVCGVCHKTLTDPESIAAGIGPVCAKKLGAA